MDIRGSKVKQEGSLKRGERSPVHTHVRENETTPASTIANSKLVSLIMMSLIRWLGQVVSSASRMFTARAFEGQGRSLS